MSEFLQVRKQKICNILNKHIGSKLLRATSLMVTVKHKAICSFEKVWIEINLFQLFIMEFQPTLGQTTVFINI